jgi:carbon monoxide dehydrogenase subunit G
VRFEKQAVVPARAHEVWDLLLDPQAMIGCVPGVESIEPQGNDVFLVTVGVKISFISARFRVRTAIVESKRPAYLRSEGAGEDATLTSSLRVKSEVFLAEQQDGSTEIRMILDVELLGRLGSFGLNVVKTKADRMWEEFGRNLSAKVEA